MASLPVIYSLDELEINLKDDVREYLLSQYTSSDDDPVPRFRRLLSSMKKAPALTVCRVNLIKATREEVIKELEDFLLTWALRHRKLDRNEVACDKYDTPVPKPHPSLRDVVIIDAIQDNDVNLAKFRVPPSFGEKDIFSNWPSRKEKGWPCTIRVVICDRFCGEAVLRGSDIFVSGVLCADLGVEQGESVAVYADLHAKSDPPVPRGLKLQDYIGHCVFLGFGVSRCSRSDFFRHSSGVGVEMSSDPKRRAGPVLPPFNGVLSGKMMLQNLPSILVGHALDPQPNDVILDMCCAPGGKTSHMASLVGNDAIIVACDKSRKKILSVRSMCRELRASCIVPLVLDTTHAVLRDGTPPRTVKEIISNALPSDRDQLLNITGFYPESFDRILLDPPCSALGVRPKLKVEIKTQAELARHSSYQQLFIREAVKLLKPGGFLVYSTCTFHAKENESNVRFLLDEFPFMKLAELEFQHGVHGLQGMGLSEEERRMVLRFEPSVQEDTMGFFIAKFIKMEAR